MFPIFSLITLACGRGEITNYNTLSCDPDPNFIPTWYEFIFELSLTGLIALGILFLAVVIVLPIGLAVVLRRRKKAKELLK